MGHQIIKQPDGHLAVWSTNTDSWIAWDAEPDELIEWFADRAAEQARESVRRVIEAVDAGDPRKIYAQFTMSFEEANREHLDRGHNPIPFGRAEPGRVDA